MVDIKYDSQVQNTVLYNSLMNAPSGIAILKGGTHIYEFANATYEKLVGKQITIGKSVQEIFPEVEQQGIIEILNTVLLTGEPFIANEFPVEINIKNDGTLDKFYLNSVVQPLKDANGNVERLLAHVIDVTAQVENRKQIEASEKRFSNILSQSIMAIGILKGPDMVVSFANEPFTTSLSKGKDIIGKTLLDIMPELKDQKPFQKLQHVYSTGKPYHGFDIKTINIQNGIEVEYYFNFVFQPYVEADHFITGVTVMATDVTDRVLAKKQMAKSELFNRTILESSPDCLKVLDSDGRIQYMNMNGLCQMEIEDFSNIKDQKWWSLWGKENEPLVKSSVKKAFQGEIVQFSAFCPTFKGTPKWWDVVISPIGNAGEPVQQIISVSRDITEQKIAEQKIAENEIQFRSLANSIPQLAWIANGDGWIHWYNQRWFDFTGTTLEEMKGWGWTKVHHPDYKDKIVDIVEKAWKKDQAFELTFPLRRHDGVYRWFLTRAYPVKDATGNIDRWIGTNTDITEQKNFTEELEVKVKERTDELLIKNQTFELAEKISKFGSYKWNIKTGSLEYSDNLYLLFDCEPQEFAPSFEKFLSFIHPDDLQEVLKNGQETILSGKLIESPYRIISKTGRVKHLRSSGSFTVGSDKNILIGTVQDISRDITVTEELRIKNLELELTNAELASFSYVASHDLKEPLRKIHTFSKRILEIENFTGKTQDYFNRIISAADRMQNLIDSLLDFSSVNSTDLNFIPCDLNALIEEAKNDLQISIIEKQAIIEYDKLPLVNGVCIQISQLITNLLDNAIKYSHPDKKPYIKITSKIIDGKDIVHASANKQKNYYAVMIADNGIGFEQSYSNKIFELFQRLHLKNEYSGTGIGLAIVNKIANNHNGFMAAVGEPGKGATFTVYLPTA